MSIQSFADRDTEEAFYEGVVRPRCRWKAQLSAVSVKLDMLDSAVKVLDLRKPPGNRLKALRGDLKGKYSIRVNAQWRIVFRWTEEGPEDVEVMDYH